MAEEGILAAVPPQPRPVRIFWIAALAIDLGLLLALNRSPWILVGLAALSLAIALLRHPAVLFAVAAVGAPILHPLNAAAESWWPGLIATFGLSVAFVLLRLWQSFWDPRRLRRFQGLLREPAWRWAAGFGLLLFAGLLWTRAPVYGGGKAQLYWMSNFLLLSFALVALRRGDDAEGLPETARPFLRALFWLQVGVALGAVWSHFAGRHPLHDRLTALGMNPIWLARHMGIGLLGALVLRRLGLLPRALFWLSLPLFAWVLLRAASRGPTLSLAAAVVFWFLTAPAPRGFRGRRGVLIVAASLAALGFAAIFVLGQEHAAGQQISNQVRLWLLKAARSALAEVSLLGLGPGGFSRFLGLPDSRWYPHNLLAEVLLENGLLGFGILLGFLFSTYAAWRRWGAALRRRGDPAGEQVLWRGAGALFVFALLCAQFSGDIPFNEWIWAFAGMIVAWAPRAAREVTSSGRRPR